VEERKIDGDFVRKGGRLVERLRGRVVDREVDW
jgi:hypothetical protein